MFTDEEKRAGWGAVCTMLGIITLILSALLLLVPVSEAGAATVSRTGSGWQQPYGGCDEAMFAPHSQGARECRAHGWTIRRHFTIDPHNRMRSTDFRPCKYEDSNGCFWNARKQGNGYGSSFVVSVHGEVFYVASW